MLRFSLLVIVVIVGGIWHAGAASAATTSHEDVTIPLSAVVPATDCVGEDVQVTGELHIVTQVVEDSAGGTHVVVTLASRDLVGTGATTGTVYHGAEGSHSAFTSRDLQNEITASFRLVLLSSGSGPNLFAYGVFHETVDPNGEVRAEVELERAGCTG
jgi:hypothetical protein